jgi:hypothetical protein
MAARPTNLTLDSPAHSQNDSAAHTIGFAHRIGGRAGVPDMSAAASSFLHHPNGTRSYRLMRAFR